MIRIVSILQLLLFFLLCLSIFYFGNCLFAKKLLRVEPKMAALYVSSMMLIGTFGEVFVNRLYDILLGHPLWTYQVAPIHHALSSQYAFFLWGIYGLHLYLLHGALDGKKMNSEKYMRYFFWIEGVAIEFITNSLFIICFHKYLFYYPANDLWHITSIQSFPAYFAGSFVIVQALKRFKKDPMYFIVMNLLLASVLVFFSV